uniref:Uncharacterized protein n=1 Tax=Alexandrium monilatum TaxID=311494 RepID=A0A7S4UXS2_9DINO
MAAPRVARSSLRHRMASGRAGGALLLASLGVAAMRALLPGAGPSFAPPALGQPAGLRRVALRAGEDGSIGTITGRCRYATGNWTLLKEVAVKSKEDEALADEAWALFEKRYQKPAKTGIYLDTPVARDDVRYRFLRLAETLKLSTKETLEVLQTDDVLMVVDADYVKNTFEAMIRGADFQKAIDIVKKNPSILVSGEDIETKMDAAAFGAEVRSFFRPLDNLIQSALGRGR